MANDREVTLIIKADGSAAIKAVNETSRAVDGLTATTGKAKPAIDGGADAVKKLGVTTEETKKSTEGCNDSLKRFVVTTGEAKQKTDWFAQEMKKAREAAKGLGDQSSSTAAALGGMKTSWEGFTTGINQGLDLLGKAKEMMNRFYDSSKSIAQLQDMRQNFRLFASSMGANSEAILSKLKAVSKGAISESQLMLQSNKAMLLGVTTDSEKLAKLMEAAILRGKLMGRSSEEAFDDIVTGIGRMSPLILDNLGIMTKGFDKLTEGMSDTEKKAKLVEIVLADHARTAKNVGSQIAESALEYEKFEKNIEGLKKAVLENFKPGVDAMIFGLNEGLIPALKEVAGWLNTTRSGIFGLMSLIPGGWGNEPTDILDPSMAVKGEGDPLMRKLKALEYYRNQETATRTKGRIVQGGMTQDGYVFSGNFETKSNEFDSIVQDAKQLRMAVDRTKREIAKALGDVSAGALGAGGSGSALVKKLSTPLAGGVTATMRAMGLPVFSLSAQDESEQKKINEKLKKDREEAKAALIRDAKEAEKAADKLKEKLHEVNSAIRGVLGLSHGQDQNAATKGFYSAAGAITRLAAGVPFDAFMYSTDKGNLKEQVKARADIKKAEAEQIERDLEMVWKRLERDNPFAVWLFGLGGGQNGAGAVPLAMQNPSSANAWTMMNTMLSTGAMGVGGQIVNGKPVEVKLDTTGVKAFDKDVAALKEKLQINVADAFEQGLYDGLNGGNFLESFGRGLRSQVARALSAGITSQIFGVGGSGGSFNLGGLFSRGSYGGGIATGADYVPGLPDMANTYASGSGASAGLAGGLFKNVWGNAGQFLWKNALSNVGVGLAVGYAADTLFGQGGVFGDARIHGAESITQAGDINAQVAEAKKQQEALLKSAVGVSFETYQAIKNLQLVNAYTTEETSGRTSLGTLFKGPKTTTYTLHSGDATATLNKFLDLLKKATEESSKRTFEVSMTALNDPTKAATMGLNDLKDALERLTAGTEEYRNIQLQIAQGEKSLSDSRNQAKAQDLSNWTSYALGNPFAGYGSDASPIPFDIWVSRPWSGGDWQGTKTSTIDPAEEAEYAVKYGFTRPELPGGKYRIGNTELDATGLRTYIDSQVMMQGLKNQQEMNLAIKRAAMKSPNDLTLDTVIPELGTVKTAYAGGKNLGNVSSTDEAWSLYKAYRGTLKTPSMGNVVLPALKIEERQQTYGDLLTKQISYYQGIMDDLEKQLQNAALETEQRNQLFASWQQAQQAYYATRTEQLNFEIAEEAKIKAKQQKLNDDRLANALTWLGETREQNGQTILILAGGQADTIERLKAIRDGLDAEGQAVINQIIDQKTASGATRWT